MKTYLTILILAVACVTGYSQTNVPATGNPSLLYKAESGDLFSKGEFQLDVAGTWTSQVNGIDQVFKTNIRDGAVGLSLGGTYFFNKYAGACAEINVVDLYNTSNLLIDNLFLGGELRYPINRFAPYGKVLVGRDFHTGIYNFQFGPGLEVRLIKRLGTFVEYRFQVRDSRKDSEVFQGGVSLVF